MKFSEWKRRLLHSLILSYLHSSDSFARDDLLVLIDQVHYSKYRDVSSILYRLVSLLTKYPNLPFRDRIEILLKEAPVEDESDE